MRAAMMSLALLAGLIVPLGEAAGQTNCESKCKGNSACFEGMWKWGRSVHPRQNTVKQRRRQPFLHQAAGMVGGSAPSRPKEAPEAIDAATL